MTVQDARLITLRINATNVALKRVSWQILKNVSSEPDGNRHDGVQIRVNPAV